MTNQIKNETIAKLNREEIGTLGLYNRGIMTYKGTLKSRRNGFKTIKVNDIQTNFENDAYKIEFIKIEKMHDEDEYAMRLFNNESNEYVTFMPLLGIEFFK